MKRIGILGGMGPESTAAFYSAVIRQCQLQYGARLDEDYPEIFIYSLPIADIVGDSKANLVREQLLCGIRKLEQAGSELIAIPCNTVFSVCPGLAKSGGVPVLDIIEETLKAAAKAGYKNLGLLATTATVKSDAYAKAAKKIRLALKLPENQNEINQIILNILAGKKNTSDRISLTKACKSLKEQGAEAVILGCTDLSLLLRQENTEVKLLDTIEILAEATVRAADRKP